MRSSYSSVGVTLPKVIDPEVDRLWVITESVSLIASVNTFSCHGSFPACEVYIRLEFTFHILPEFSLIFFFGTEGSRTPDLHYLSIYIAPSEDNAWKTKNLSWNVSSFSSKIFFAFFWSKVLVTWSLSVQSRNSNGMESYLEVWEVSTVPRIPPLGQPSRYFPCGPSCIK